MASEVLFLGKRSLFRPLSTVQSGSIRTFSQQGCCSIFYRTKLSPRKHKQIFLHCTTFRPLFPPFFAVKCYRLMTKGTPVVSVLNRHAFFVIPGLLLKYLVECFFQHRSKKVVMIVFDCVFICVFGNRGNELTTRVGGSERVKPIGIRRFNAIVDFFCCPSEFQKE